MGWDVESMIRDLVEFAVTMVRRRMLEDVQTPALERAEQRLIDVLLPRSEKKFSVPDFMKVFGAGADTEEERPAEEEHGQETTRTKLLAMLQDGRLNDREVDVEVSDNSAAIPVLGGAGILKKIYNI